MSRGEKTLIPTFRQVTMKQGRLSTGSEHCGVFLWWRQAFSLADGDRVSLEKPMGFV